ncbi:diguanylate cyclase [Sulfurospirillum deleyianum]|uniref:diguanylate cyclase n=1 Tax=Sulfurospirillum deleyianum (strain ATCC 51133 / DSM 6946 / 5175) TaxID=525898 RepID=D1B3T2_SULD5|nr:diguanylate cyclase [Sulfurospirillum deleyianum]ACZ12752.1 diguanylate cyclase [Sulfurospirillum deleyianum DSM 6946]
MVLTCAVFLFYVLDSRREKKFIEELALSQARSVFQKDLRLYRWISQQGGIYIRSTDTNASHEAFTFVNPTEIVDHVNEDSFGSKGGLQGRLIHLHRLENLPNPPDAWEKEALAKLSANQHEVYDFNPYEGKEHLRFMGALVVDESCLKCHHEMHKGDVKGGISVSLSLENYDEIAQKRAQYSLWIYGFFWICGLVSLGVAMAYLVRLLRKHHLLVEESDELRLLNQIDPLTNVSNRRVFERWLEEKMTLYKTHRLSSCMIMMDIDFFKKVNDTYGHLVGDEVLIALANRMKHYVRDNDCLVRFGGEEFALLLFNTSAKRGYIIAERLRRMVEALKISLPHHPSACISVTMSFGMSTFLNYDTTIENIISRADKAMYLAKKEGRNRVKIEL